MIIISGEVLKRIKKFFKQKAFINDKQKLFFCITHSDDNEEIYLHVVSYDKQHIYEFIFNNYESEGKSGVINGTFFIPRYVFVKKVSALTISSIAINISFHNGNIYDENLPFIEYENFDIQGFIASSGYKLYSFDSKKLGYSEESLYKSPFYPYSIPKNLKLFFYNKYSNQKRL